MNKRDAAAAYEAKHVAMHAGRPVAIHNPHNLPVEELPVIYGFNNGGNSVWGFEGTLIAQDGTYLGGHLCSSEAYMPADLGVLEGTSPSRHETFRAHYPDGYRMEFVGYDAIDGHDRLKAVIALANAAAIRRRTTPRREPHDRGYATGHD